MNISSSNSPSTATFSAGLSFSTAQNRFTYTGTTKRFLLTLSVAGESSSSGQLLRFSARGSTPSSPTNWTRANTAANSNYDATYTNIITLNSGDYIEPVMYNESGGATIRIMTLNFTLSSLD